MPFSVHSILVIFFLLLLAALNFSQLEMEDNGFRLGGLSCVLQKKDGKETDEMIGIKRRI